MSWLQAGLATNQASPNRRPAGVGRWGSGQARRAAGLAQETGGWQALGGVGRAPRDQGGRGQRRHQWLLQGAGGHAAHSGSGERGSGILRWGEAATLRREKTWSASGQRVVVAGPGR